MQRTSCAAQSECRRGRGSWGFGRCHGRFGSLGIGGRHHDRVHLLGDQVFEDRDLLRGVGLRGPDHRGINPRVLGELLHALFKPVEPVDAGDAHLLAIRVENLAFQAGNYYAVAGIFQHATIFALRLLQRHQG